LHAVERAARPPAARQPSPRTTLAQQELAQTLAAAAAGAASTASAAASGGSTPAAAAATVTTGAAVGTATTAATPAATATAATAAAPAASTGPPTAQSVFGANPWETDPTGSGPAGTYNYNPYYFATPQTAADVASEVGGTVVQVNCFGQSEGNPFTQNQPNEMVELANGTMLNPGLVASFYTHGYPQSMVDQMIANEVANVSKGN
jgi:hypothetical protein